MRLQALSPSSFAGAPVASAIALNRATAALAHVFLHSVRALWSGLWELLRHSRRIMFKAMTTSFRTVASTTRAPRAGGGVSIATSTRANGGGQSLHDAIGRNLARSLAGVHAVIGGEVSTNHICFHGDASSSHIFRLIREVGTILSIVDSDFAAVAFAGRKRIVDWLWPLPPTTDACCGE